MKYKIYAGLSGGFGGATYQKTEDYSSMDETLEDAYALAVEEYQSYEDCHGIMSWDDCREDLIDLTGQRFGKLTVLERGED